MNLYEYVSSRPSNRFDPKGTAGWAWHAAKGKRSNGTVWFEPDVDTSAESAHIRYNLHVHSVKEGASEIRIDAHVKTVHQIWSWYTAGLGETGYVAKYGGTVKFICDKDNGHIIKRGTFSGWPADSGKAHSGAMVTGISEWGRNGKKHYLDLTAIWSGSVTGTVTSSFGVSLGAKAGANGVEGELKVSVGRSVSGNGGKSYNKTFVENYICECTP